MQLVNDGEHISIRLPTSLSKVTDHCGQQFLELEHPVADAGQGGYLAVPKTDPRQKHGAL